jgi:hypothetical protein
MPTIKLAPLKRNRKQIMHMGFEILMAMNAKITVFWDAT